MFGTKSERHSFLLHGFADPACGWEALKSVSDWANAVICLQPTLGSAPRMLAAAHQAGGVFVMPKILCARVAGWLGARAFLALVLTLVACSAAFSQTQIPCPVDSPDLGYPTHLDNGYNGINACEIEGPGGATVDFGQTFTNYTVGELVIESGVPLTNSGTIAICGPPDGLPPMSCSAPRCHLRLSRLNPARCDKFRPVGGSSRRSLAIRRN
jgi:hypothetical protein